MSATKLTKRSVDAVEPRQRRFDIWDAELKGFGLRVEASGTKTYILRYRPQGFGPGALKRFLVIGRHGAITPDEGRGRAKALLGAVAGGQDPAGDRTQIKTAVTVGALVELFLNEHVKTKRKPWRSMNFAIGRRAP